MLSKKLREAYNKYFHIVLHVVVYSWREEKRFINKKMTYMISQQNSQHYVKIYNAKISRKTSTMISSDLLPKTKSQGDYYTHGLACQSIPVGLSATYWFNDISGNGLPIQVVYT